MTTASVRSVTNDEGGAADNRSEVSRRPVPSNSSLYNVTPPVYAVTAADNEVSIEAQEYREGKSETQNGYYPPERPHTANTERTQSIPEVRAGPSSAAELPAEQPPVYFQQLTHDTVLASVRKCDVLVNRPAVWLVKRKDYALSPLAATVLLKEGILAERDLSIVPQSAGTKRDPTDPLSGVAFATYDTVGDILLGLVEGPVEVARQVHPLILKHDQKRRGDSSGLIITNTVDGPTLMRRESVPESPARHEEDPSIQLLRTHTNGSSASKGKTKEGSGGAHAVKQVAIGTGRGFGRIVGAALKSPMTISHGVTRGFHNMPKLYGDEVRQFENVTDIRSGLIVSAKSLGYGIGDGLRDLFVQPIVGAQKESGIGFVKGIGKGIGSVICKPAAGLNGVASYNLVGIYKSISSLKPTGMDGISEKLRAQGELEYNQAADQTRLEVVRRWCQMTMRQHQA